MKIKGISIDYSNICKDYNTVYLDRDNKDRDTQQCMKNVVSWLNEFLSALLENTGYNIYHLQSDVPVKIEDVASNRFLFYSLEKGITDMCYVIQKEFTLYDNFADWKSKEIEGLAIQNDEEGEGIILYFKENSQIDQWISEKLKDFKLSKFTA